jgi:MFS superfamily sulfate permease-like transporter/CRP-like cAMP-binding protein
MARTTIADMNSKRATRHNIASRFSGVAHEIGAGITTACVTLPLCVSAGVLVYSALGGDYVSRGAIAGLVCSVAGGIAAAIFRTSSFVWTFPTTPIALVQASSAGAILATLEGDTGMAVAALPMMVVLVALWQILFGATGLSRVIKFTPYPVIAGFVTGVGCLIVIQQIPRFFGVESFAELLEFAAVFSLPRPAIPVFAAVLVAAMLAVGRWLPRVPALLAGLVGGTLAHHALSALIPGLDLGSTIGKLSPGSLSFVPAIGFGDVYRILLNFDAVRLLIFGSLTLALLGTLDTFFALRAAQHMADIAVSPKRDLIGQGIANFISAWAGGLVVSTSLSVSTANFRAGGRTRLSTVTAGVVLLFGVWLLPDVIFSLPVVVLAAILLAAALRIVDRWTFEVTRQAIWSPHADDRHRARLNAAVVFAVLLATVFGQPVIGAGVGVALAGLIFVAQMSRPIVGNRLSGERLRSKRVRSHREMAALSEHAQEILVLELQGVLFFGNSDDLAAELRKLQSAVRIVILDMRRVTDVDISGIAALRNSAARLRKSDAMIAVCRADRRFDRLVRQALGEDARMFGDRDDALEWAEQEILLRPGHEKMASDLDLAEADVADRMTPRQLEVLHAHTFTERYPSGTVLCQSGDAPDRIWIVRKGSVGIRVRSGRGNIRLASLGPGCSVGEMGLLDKRARSADVYAETALEAYVMTAEKFEAILRDHPDTGQAILTNIARQLAQRLRATSEDLRLSEQ